MQQLLLDAQHQCPIFRIAIERFGDEHVEIDAGGVGVLLGAIICKIVYCLIQTVYIYMNVLLARLHRWEFANLSYGLGGWFKAISKTGKVIIDHLNGTRKYSLEIDWLFKIKLKLF